MDSSDSPALTACGYTRVAQNDPYPVRRHPQGHQFDWRDGRVLQTWQFVYLTEGQGILETKAQPKQILGAGDVFVLFPGVWHRYSPLPETGWTEHWMELQGCWVAEVLRTENLSAAYAILRPGVSAELVSHFDRLHDYAQHGGVREQRLLAAMARLLAELILYHGLRPAKVTQTEQLVQAFQAKLTEQSDGSMRIKDIARGLRKQETHLRRSFKKQTGLTPKRYTLTLRLRKACELLRNTTLSVQEIAEDLGFYSASHFSMTFKRTFGKSPSHWRENEET